MPLRERWGLELTAASEQARDAYVAGTDGILMPTADPKQHLHASIEEDPEFALAHAALPGGPGPGFTLAPGSPPRL